MKREEIKAIFPDATDEQLKSVLDINGADVEKAKAKATALEAELKDKKEAFDSLTSEMEKLKKDGATAEEWKTKFEALQADTEAKAKAAEAERVLAAKKKNIKDRFDACVGDKAFTHEAVMNAYLDKFEKAVEAVENQGKTDADVFHSLTKDDASAFKGVQGIKLAGGNAQGNGKYKNREEIMAIKDGTTRRAEMLANRQFFPELND